ncbi:hypothetical protein POM88_002122 [Heracleum sosnowskyi]|uniref:Uncharacterized protein n=1 Tax=Heracleum sosnowskyi TaxID=360622 RepID=A0AAD8JDT7_9APIA|nr:hypothetical protein POM88_002122 [Heracleum sosnowskyi]
MYFKADCVARELLSWVEDSKKGGDILSLVEKEPEREKNSVKSEKKEGEKELEGEKNTKPEEDEGEKELKTELAALENLLKRATKCLHDEVKTHQYSQVPTKDRTDFRNELKYEADMLNTAKKGLAIDAESKIVGAKMTSLKLINRDALRKAFKHLTENPFKDDEHFAGHIITLILPLS